VTKTLIEFVNTCPSCDGHERVVREVAAKFGEAIDCRIYRAGKDFAYVAKYGPLTRGTLIIDGGTRIEELSRAAIETAISDAVKRAGSR
jgi:hypothetical protein